MSNKTCMVGSCAIEGLKALTDKLNAKVVEKINDTQELVMVNDFARETNETLINKSLKDRIADIASWRWVFSDLSQRLDESVKALKHEQKAIKVVVQRIDDEIEQHAKIKPGCLGPGMDSVEKAVMKEFTFLCDQKASFEKMITVIDKQVANTENIKNRVNHDIAKKDETLAREESCANITKSSLTGICGKKKKKKGSSLTLWENKCMNLKRNGLRALCKAVMIRQQVRGARVQLTIAAQAYANKVESALRRRLHTNHFKLQEIEWQRQESLRDLQCLEEETLNTEQSLLANMEQERVVEAKLADRSFRPPGELTRDEVDNRLRGELARVRHFVRDLRSNLSEIKTLKDHLQITMAKMDCVAADIQQVVQLDEKRMVARFGDVSSVCSPSCRSQSTSEDKRTKKANMDSALHTIKEENENESEDDDYPFP
ncbi:tektin-2-like isoform X2 [Pectinophora gossypiella]|uniref:tektin-2-like isoform X2 n=1 Tax=Pectinophora gossypiella TaxID=13191 RepID=UPI00214EA521|nr:tektin-2-like isoform X2 [Pectinophora gossypiella]